jgi:hypothetical protein
VPHETLAKLASKVRETTVEVIWRQWGSMGAQATGSHGSANLIIDPEALIFATMAVESLERRLTDLLEDWVAVNSNLLSVQRLRNLAGHFPQSAEGGVPRIAEVAANRGRDARWRSPGEKPGPGRGRARSNRVRAIEVPFGNPATLLLQLRRGLGVGVKSDVIALLLGATPPTDNWVSAPQAAEALGYTPSAVKRALDDLADARLVNAIPRVRSRPKERRHFSAADTGWATLLGFHSGGLHWGWWLERYAFLTEFLSWADASTSRTLSAYAAGVELRELLHKHSFAFSAGRRMRSVEPRPSDDPVEAFTNHVEDLLTELKNRA